MSIREKPIEWRDTSLEDLKTFPIEAIKHFGYELGLIQNGLEPSDFKPMPNLGSGEHGFPLLSGAGRLVVKDTVILAGAITLLSDTAGKLLKQFKN